MTFKYTTLLIKHDAITEQQILGICTLKAKRWNYSLSQHREWIEKNIDMDDYHVMIYEHTELVAYTNLVTVVAIVNGGAVNFKGIGNVCTSETGKGYGNLLMDEVNSILKRNSWMGFLLCKNNLVSYYRKFKWHLVNTPITDNKKETGINYMTYNLDSLIYRFDYLGDNF